MQLDKCIIIVLKLTLVVEIEALLSCRQPPLLDRSLRLPVAVPFLGRHTKILTTWPWSLSFTDAYMPKLTVLAKL